MTRPRVLLVAGEYPPMRGGVGDYSACLSAALHELGVHVHVLTSRKADARFGDAIPTSGAATQHGSTVGPVVDRWGFGCWRTLAHTATVSRADVVHIQFQAGAYDLHAAVPLWPLVARLRRSRPRIVVTFHDLLVPYLFPKAGPLRRLVMNVFAAAADHVIVTNRADANRLRWLGPRVTRIPIGSNIPVAPVDSAGRCETRRKLGVGSDEVAIGFFGFLTPTKGVEVLLDALPRLDALGVPARLVMIGGSDGPSAASDPEYGRRIRQIASEPRVQGRVIWTGFASPEQTSSYLQAMDLCVLPFLEGASLRHGTLLAALVHGLPIVTTRPPEDADDSEIVDGVHARLVEPGDPVGLAQAIAELGRNPDHRRRLAEGAQSLGSSLSWDRIARDTLSVYEQVIAGPHGAVNRGATAG